MAYVDDGREQGAHWKTAHGAGQACYCEIGYDHTDDAQGSDVTAPEVPQHVEEGRE